MKAALLGRALRWPFLSASILPYICGALLPETSFHPLSFALGFLAVATLHLSANLINDYADDLSGADWQDTKFYGFFGGSKLIQEGRLSAQFYRHAAILCAVISVSAVVALAVLLHRPVILLCYCVILLLAWAYSHGPLRLAYHRLGEVTIFLLFGPAVVYGGSYIQMGDWPPLSDFLHSLPFGFLTAAILVANEVPDCEADQKVGKRNLVNWMGAKNGYRIYAALLAAGYVAILLLVIVGSVGTLSLLAFLTVPLGWRALRILRTKWADKSALTKSAALTIVLHAVVSLCLILGAIL